MTPMEAAPLSRAASMERDRPLVWNPHTRAAPTTPGAHVDIATRSIRQLAVHHLGQHGQFGHGDHAAAIRVYRPGDDIEASVVYIGTTIPDVIDLVDRASRVRPVGLLAPGDLAHLPAVTTAILSGVSGRGPAADGIATASADLSSRTLAVLDYVAQGLTNAEIADEMNFSLSTVKRDVTELLDWFRASSRRELARAARQLGLIPTPYGGLEPSDAFGPSESVPGRQAVGGM